MVRDAGTKLSYLMAMGMIGSPSQIGTRWWYLTIRNKLGSIIVVSSKVRVAALGTDPHLQRNMEIVKRT